MLRDAGDAADPWERFGRALDLARNRLDAGRNRYEGLVEMNEPPPDRYASTLQDVETDLETIDDVLDVSEDDAAASEEIAERTRHLADVLDAAWTFHTALLDVELDIYRTWHGSLEAVGAVDCSDATAQLDPLTELANSENYTQLRTGDPFTLDRLRRSLVAVERAAMESMAPDEYVERCLESVEEFETQFTADLRRLVQADAAVQVKSDRAAVTALIDELDRRLDERNLDDDAVVDARCALEGAMMLKYYTAYANYAYEYCERLAAVLERIDGATTTDEDLVEERAVDELAARVEAAIVGATVKSDTERAVDLLREHGGSLDSALGASEMDVATFFDAVRTAFEDDQIADIQVPFE